MARAQPSRSAQNVALVRANLARWGIVNDPYARQMLSPDRRWHAVLFSVPGLRFRLPGIPGLAARTLFFDAFVHELLDGGIRQVVIVGAGYDSRAWRLARPGVTFFEIDRPATQDDKRARAPEGGPVYIPADVTDPELSEKLVHAGFRTDQPSAFTLEGLVAYMEKDQVTDLFARLADLASAGSRMAVSFDNGFQNRRFFSRYARAYYKRAGERWRFRLQSEDAPSFLAGTGWTVNSIPTRPELDEKHLSGTKLAGRLSTLDSSSFLAVAER